MPAAIAEPVRQVVERPVRLLSKGPGQDGEIAPGRQHFKWAEFGDLAGKFDGHLLASLVDGAISGLAQPDEVVILGDDLARRPREVDGQGGHGAAQVIDVEDQIGIEILKLAPDDPAHAGIDQTILMP